jgi:hypothetical protein
LRLAAWHSAATVAIGLGEGDGDGEGLGEAVGEGLAVGGTAVGVALGGTAVGVGATVGVAAGGALVGAAVGVGAGFVVGGAVGAAPLPQAVTTTIARARTAVTPRFRMVLSSGAVRGGPSSPDRRLRGASHTAKRGWVSSASAFGSC